MIDLFNIALTSNLNSEPYFKSVQSLIKRNQRKLSYLILLKYIFIIKIYFYTIKTIKSTATINKNKILWSMAPIKHG